MSSIKEIVKDENIKNVNNDTIYKIIAILIVAIVVITALFLTKFWDVPFIGPLLHEAYSFYSKLIWQLASLIRYRLLM